jgi:hypothetical protein
LASAEELGASGFDWPRNDDFVRKRKQRCKIIATIRVRVAIDLDLQHCAAHPRSPSLAYQPENALNRFRLGAHAGLALCVFR